MANENTSNMSCEDIVLKLFDVESIKFGSYQLKTGASSPIYINLRVIIGYPDLLRKLSELIYLKVKEAGVSYNVVCGVPYTALPLATCMSLDHNIPMVIRRKEAKDYGTKQMIEGVYKEGDTCLIVEDVVTSGSSILETWKELKKVGLVCKDAVVLLDRRQCGKRMVSKEGIALHSLFELQNVLDILLKHGKISKSLFNKCVKFIDDNQFHYLIMDEMIRLSDRRDMATNSVAKRIFQIMDDKNTYLAFSCDVTTCAEALRLIDLVGPYCCIIKTHIDILTDFTESFVERLQELSRKHNFVIFEDRKFGDIGNTVKRQYSGGMYEISKWAHLTNAHAVPGEGIIKGLKEVVDEMADKVLESEDEDAKYEPRACLLVAEMSSGGALTGLDYTNRAIEMAKKHTDYIIGFISQTRVCKDNPAFLHMTPGVSLEASSDSLGQQYITPYEVIRERRCDIVIVGRGIYEAPDPVEAAKKCNADCNRAFTDLVNYYEFSQ